MPRVIDNLQEQETISTKIIRIAFAPTGEFPNPIPGVLTLGGTEKENYIGELKWVEIPAPIGNADLWGVEQTVTYDKETLLTGNALVDVGCTAIYFKEGMYFVSVLNDSDAESRGFREVQKSHRRRLQSVRAESFEILCDTDDFEEKRTH